MTLLCENDWHSLEVSLRKMNDVTLYRTLGDVKIEASTVHVKKAWPVAMLVCVRVEARQKVQRQYFESVKAAREAVERWAI